jgi:hypothetical protein
MVGKDVKIMKVLARTLLLFFYTPVVVFVLIFVLMMAIFVLMMAIIDKLEEFTV